MGHHYLNTYLEQELPLLRLVPADGLYLVCPRLILRIALQRIKDAITNHSL
jgi:hypothetical protein